MFIDQFFKMNRKKLNPLDPYKDVMIHIFELVMIQIINFKAKGHFQSTEKQNKNTLLIKRSSRTIESNTNLIITKNVFNIC